MDRQTKAFTVFMGVLAAVVLMLIVTSSDAQSAQQRVRITWTAVTEDMRGDPIPPDAVTYNAFGAKGNDPIVPVATNILGNDHVVTVGDGCYALYVTAYRSDLGIESEPSNVEAFCTDQVELEADRPEVDTSGRAPRIPALTVEKLYE